MVKKLAENGNWKVVAICVTILIFGVSVIYAAGGLGRDIKTNTGEVARVHEEGCKPSKTLKVEQVKIRAALGTVQDNQADLTGEVVGLEHRSDSTEHMQAQLVIEQRVMKEDISEAKGDISDIKKAQANQTEYLKKILEKVEN